MSTYLTAETRAIEIRIDPEVPSEVLQAIQPLIEKHLWVIPSFVHFIYVRWTTNEDDAALSATVAEEYRRMTFWVHASWLSNTPRGRETDVRHELLHAVTEPLYRFGQKMIDWTNPDEKVRQLLKEDLRIAVEKVTCDLQNMLDRRDLFTEEETVPRSHGRVVHTPCTEATR